MYLTNKRGLNRLGLEMHYLDPGGGGARDEEVLWKRGGGGGLSCL
jgi:hypothetical protein